MKPGSKILAMLQRVGCSSSTAPTPRLKVPLDQLQQSMAPNPYPTECRSGYGGVERVWFPAMLRKTWVVSVAAFPLKCCPWPKTPVAQINSTVFNLVSGSAARRIGSPCQRLGHGFPPTDCSFASSPDLDSGNSPPDFSSASSPARPRLHSRATISSVCCWPCSQNLHFLGRCEFIVVHCMRNIERFCV